jgi:hypothetical protein
MTGPSDPLRTGLTAIASRVDSVDLYDRSLARSRQINRRRGTGASLLAAVAVVSAVAVWQLVPGPNGVPQPPTSPPATPGVSDSATTPAPSVTSPGAPRIAAGDLTNATLEIPAWPTNLPQCRSGQLTFTNNKVDSRELPDQVGMTITKTVAQDVDNDGAAEAVAFVACRGPGEGVHTQVVVYRGGPAGPVLLGRVFGSISTPTTTGEPVSIRDVSAAPSGRITLALRSGPAGSAPPQYGQVDQTRVYGWNGTEFAQVSGPSSFTIDADVVMTATPMRFGPANGHCRTGTVTVTVKNNGQQAVRDTKIALIHPTVDAGECAGGTPTAGFESTLVTVGDLAAGVTKSIPITVMNSQDGVSGTTIDESWNYLELRVGVQRLEDHPRLVISYE